MDYKKKYEDAFEKAKKVYNREDATNGGKLILESMFPELKESEDEKIRKEIITYLDREITLSNFGGDIATFKEWIVWFEKQDPKKHEEELERAYKCADEVQYRKGYEDAKKELEKQGEHKCDCKYVGCHVNDVKRWCHKKQAKILYEKCNIECSEYLKQGEQKPTDKVEPKSDIEKGKWYVCNTSRYRDFVVGKAYYCPKNGMLKPNENEMARYVARNCFHLWTIEDAKDGDVLVVNNEVFIYAHRKQMYPIAVAHCFVNSVGDFYFDGEFGYTERENSIHPATEEQRDLLFQKMKKSGYEWDAEKKELNGIKNNSTWSKEDAERYYGVIETEQYMLDVVNGIKKFDVGNEQIKEECTKELTWLKSLKERMKGE